MKPLPAQALPAALPEDLAQHLGLRPREDLLTAIEAAGLTVVERLDTKPTHPKASDRDDPLFEAAIAAVRALERDIALIPRFSRLDVKT